mmetsp:Transcript_20702/g.57472  ORF Transcript_20702/g.57472 Transcript_20702/m.57472 type:complete len:293 (-) Transcript_20702:2187-3065(-)
MGLALLQALGGDLKGVVREAFLRHDELQLLLHLCLPPLVHALPGGEARHHSGRHLRVDLVDGADHLAHKAVAAAVRGMEVDGAMGGEGEEEVVAVVGVLDVEGRVLHQSLDGRQVPLHIGGSLQAEPLEHHERLLLPLGIELSKGDAALGAVLVREGSEGGDLVGHVGRLAEPLKDLCVEVGIVEGGEVAHALVFEGALGRGGRIRRVGLPGVRVVGRQGGLEDGLQLRRDGLGSVHAHGVEHRGVALGPGVVELTLRGHCDSAGNKGFVQGGVLQDGLESGSGFAHEFDGG